MKNKNKNKQQEKTGVGKTSWEGEGHELQRKGTAECNERRISTKDTAYMYGNGGTTAYYVQLTCANKNFKNESKVL